MALFKYLKWEMTMLLDNGCEIPNLNSPIIFVVQCVGVKLPNLKTANISSYTVYSKRSQDEQDMAWCKRECERSQSQPSRLSESSQLRSQKWKGRVIGLDTLPLCIVCIVWTAVIVYAYKTSKVTASQDAHKRLVLQAYLEYVRVQCCM